MKFFFSLILAAIAVTSTTAATDDNCSFGCLDVYEPVCGSNGETYSNACYLRLASCKTNNEITQASGGECASAPAPSSSATAAPQTSTSSSSSGNDECPGACPDVYDPVSDENGVQYSNACYMQMANCKEGSGNIRRNNPGFSTLDALR